MAVDLKDYRLIYVGPRNHVTAIGDYTEDLVEAYRSHFGDVAEVRVSGPGDETWADVRRVRKRIRDLVASWPVGKVLVHSEIGCGMLSPFWSIAGLDDVPVTLTVHDPPQALWFTARTRFVAKHKLLMHGFHYPLRPVSRWLEGKVNDRRHIFALSKTGQASIDRVYPRMHTHYVPYRVADKPEIKPPEDRPKAIGFFGLVYRGKGFEQIAQIREELPDDILIRIAGRGTEALPRADGIEIVGGIDGAEEDAFFESVRAIVIPYGKRHFYADTFPASSVAAHALAYRTPIVATGYGSLAEFDAETGAVVVPMAAGDENALPPGFTDAIASFVDDDDRVAQLGRNAERTRDERSTRMTAEAFVAAWSDILGGQSEGA
ncbi:glycosyltransferase family 4 protein [Mycobacterium yunnanensis]|uniref:Glycosyltransferase family 4 protein n=1 Tax=Mycobacterium yunnanensis TaxID=368477 RepID=A0A9X2Z150_9MYCO|nr:glycosyltransferase family 1 protein [Mycobacterium yunnanensis]MCV7421975.1 glycosyltransferase family 4 protein [Mycobacterium yunnanensis]